MSGTGALKDGWLAEELDAIKEETALWPDGIKESFNSTLKPGEEHMRIPLGLPPCPHCGRKRDE